jgi:PAS domain S-box-containing protein
VRNEFAEILFEEAPDAILVATTDGRYLDANPAAEKLLGYSREEPLTLRIHDLIFLEDIDRMEQGRQERLAACPGRNDLMRRFFGFSYYELSGGQCICQSAGHGDAC